MLDSVKAFDNYTHTSIYIYRENITYSKWNYLFNKEHLQTYLTDIIFIDEILKDIRDQNGQNCLLSSLP